jgi:hypothetical protein
MAADDQGETRGELARWLVERDEVDEAARVLLPGDEVALGKSDSLALAAALKRRGLDARYQPRRLTVTAATRRPPARVLPPPPTAKKNLA